MGEAKAKCIVPGCERNQSPFRRGCCFTCYQTATQQIKLGDITEDELINAGLFLPSKKPRAKPKAMMIAISAIKEGKSS